MISRKLATAAAALAFTLTGLAITDVATAAKPAPNPTAHAVKGQPGRGNLALKGLPPEVSSGPSTKLAPVCSAPPCLAYSEQHQIFPAGNESTSTSSTVSVSNPYLATSANNNAGQDDGHSLFEVEMQNAGTGGSRNIVEVGWTKDNQGVCATASQPCLFVYSWVNDIPQGYNGGNGWTNAPGCSPCAGASLAGAVGTNKSFGLAYNSGASRWEASYNGTVFGWYPQAGWSGAFVNANALQNFGEMGSNTTAKMCSDMGSGSHAGAGASTIVSGYTQGGSSVTPALTAGFVSDPTVWAQTTISTTSFRLGGEGYDSNGVNLGTKGSCAPAAQGTPAASSFQAWQEECPDSNGTTGCTAAWSKDWATATIGACVIIPSPGTTITNAVWNNSGSSGKTFAIYRSGTCGGTAMTFGNAAKAVLPAGWNGTAVRAYRRTA